MSVYPRVPRTILRTHYCKTEVDESDRGSTWPRA